MSLVSALQLPTLPMNEAKLDYYARVCDKKDIRLVVLGEYVLNSFFKELENMPKGMIKVQSKHKIKMLKNLSKTYNLTIIAPIVRVIDNKVTKSILKSSPKSMRYYPQYFYINFKHWNEDSFFYQEEFKYTLPTFTHEGIKYGLIMGFELYFDYVWNYVDKKNVDVVLLPSVSTFESQDRWNELLKCRALTHNVYILRVNRVGSFLQKSQSWNFYGNSSLIDPYGEIKERLGSEEAMLVVDIRKSEVKEAKKLWKFNSSLRKKGIL